MASAITHQWPQEGGVQALGRYGKGLESPPGYRGALSGTETLLMPGKGVLWLFIATAVPSSFGCGEAISGGGEDKAGGTKGRVSEETDKGGWLTPGTGMSIGQGCDQYRLRRDPGKGRRTRPGPISARPTSSAH